MSDMFDNQESEETFKGNVYLIFKPLQCKFLMAKNKIKLFLALLSKCFLHYWVLKGPKQQNVSF